MPTFKKLQENIADDVDDDHGEYADQIIRAIRAAIRFCEVERYYFTENMGSNRYPDLEGDEATNPWTEDGYDLIKARAKYILAKDTLKDADVATEAFGDWKEQDARLKRETSYRGSRGSIVPTWF